MTEPVVTASLEADISEVAKKLIAKGVHSLPVVDGDEVVGMLSRSDLLRTLVRTDDILAMEVQHRLDEYSGGTRRWTAAVTDAAVTIEGSFDDDVERRIVTVLARTIPGVRSATCAEPAKQ
jgi:signal-transduction protein with cAMP-binding, CBS, and nucleotidyltransferase domain